MDAESSEAAVLQHDEDQLAAAIQASLQTSAEPASPYGQVTRPTHHLLRCYYDAGLFNVRHQPLRAPQFSIGLG